MFRLCILLTIEEELENKHKEKEMDYKTIQNAKVLELSEYGVFIRITTPDGTSKDFRGMDEVSLADKVYDDLELRQKLGFDKVSVDRAWNVIHSNLCIAVSNHYHENRH